METFLVGTSRARDKGSSYSRDRRRREGNVALRVLSMLPAAVFRAFWYSTRGVFLSKRLSNKLALVPRVSALGDFVDHQNALREEHQRPEEEAREQKRPLGG